MGQSPNICSFGEIRHSGRWAGGFFLAEKRFTFSFLSVEEDFGGERVLIWRVEHHSTQDIAGQRTGGFFLAEKRFAFAFLSIEEDFGKGKNFIGREMGRIRQCGAYGNAARCDGQRSALHRPSHRTAFPAPLRQPPSPCPISRLPPPICINEEKLRSVPDGVSQKQRNVLLHFPQNASCAHEYHFFARKTGCRVTFWYATALLS